eukprot:247862-Pyramimonas_sp.AAC.1
MNLKAAEASTLLTFATSELIRYGGAAVFGDAILGCGASLETIVNKLKESDIIPPPHTMRDIMTALDTHLLSTVAAGIALTPKHHLLAHMLHRSEGVGGRKMTPASSDGRIRIE